MNYNNAMGLCILCSSFSRWGSGRTIIEKRDVSSLWRTVVSFI